MKDRLKSALTALSGSLEERDLTGAALGNWRWHARQRLLTIRDGLGAETALITDGWLAARAGVALRERNALMARVMELGPTVLAEPDILRVRADLLRLVVDVQRHLQRLHDLAYDDVEMEIGGSE